MGFTSIYWKLSVRCKILLFFEEKALLLKGANQFSSGMQKFTSVATNIENFI